MAHGQAGFSAASLEHSCVEALVRASDLGDKLLQTWDCKTSQPRHRQRILKAPTPEKAMCRPKGTKITLQKRRLLDIVPAMVSFKPFLRPTFRRSDKDWVGMRGALRKTQSRVEYRSLATLNSRPKRYKPDFHQQHEDLEARIAAALTSKRPSALQPTSLSRKRGKVPVCRSLGSPRNSLERRLVTPVSILLLPFKAAGL